MRVRRYRESWSQLSVHILVPVFLPVTQPQKLFFLAIRVPSPEAVETIIVTIEDYYSDFLHMKDR